MRSPAKINLTLAVGAARADGYHDLESIVALLDWGDDVTVDSRDDDRIVIACDQPGIPLDESNLAARAALALRRHAGRCDGATITLTKRIPAGAGLGGGSSNAATTLLLLNRLWNLRLSIAELAEVGASVGSDVPVFLHGPLSIMRGRGEQVSPLRASLVSAVVVVMPPIHSATAAVYRAFDALPPPSPHESADALVERVARLNVSLPAGPRQIAGPDLMPHVFNDLERAAFAASPALAEFADHLRAASGLPFCMSGSGAAFFHLFDKYTDRRYFADMQRRIADALPGTRVEQTFAAL